MFYQAINSNQISNGSNTEIDWNIFFCLLVFKQQKIANRFFCVQKRVLFKVQHFILTKKMIFYDCTTTTKQEEEEQIKKFDQQQQKYETIELAIQT